MLHDQHCHTRYSVDSNASLDNYYNICQKNGCEYFITTEHIDFNCVCNNQDWTVDFPNLKEELKCLHHKYPNCTPLLGIELGYRKEFIFKMEEVLRNNDFDLVNLSVHDNGIYDYYEQKGFINEGIPKMLDEYFDNVYEAVDTFDNFDVLSHFDFGFKTAYLLDKEISINQYEQKVRKIFRRLIEKNKTLEINMKVQNMINHTHLETILKWYREEGGKNLTLSSDSHTEMVYETYYQTRQLYIDIIKKKGFKKLSYFVNRTQYTYDI